MQVKPGLAQWDAYRRAVLHPPEGTKDGKPMSRTTALLAQLNDIRLKALLGASEKDLTPLLYATLGLIADRLAAGKQTMVASPFREFSIALEARHAQTGNRVHRLTSKSPVSIYVLTGTGTIAERNLAATWASLRDRLAQTVER